MRDPDKASMKADIFYVADRLALAMSLGNTNQVRRDCWNSFFSTVNANVRSFVNGINEEYMEGKFHINFILNIYLK